MSCLARTMPGQSLYMYCGRRETWRVLKSRKGSWNSCNAPIRLCARQPKKLLQLEWSLVSTVQIRT